MCSGGSGPIPIENLSDEDLQGYVAPSQGIPVLDENGNQISYVDDYGNQIFLTNPNENYDSELEQYNSAQAEIARRQQIKDQLAAQAAERENSLKIQREQAAQMQQQQTAIFTQQQEQATRLQAQQSERLGSIRAAGTAVTQSLQILGQSSGKQAPTAAMSSKPKAARGARASTASLRMGSTSQGTGSGANIAV
jgi:hypothetical protein